jgi:hypothetical protein
LTTASEFCPHTSAATSKICTSWGEFSPFLRSIQDL